MKPPVPYAEMTVNDRNPLKRWFQRRRFADALRVLDEVRSGSAPAGRRLRVLDYGAGDGELLRRMADRPGWEAVAYEPTPYMAAEARAKLAGLDRVTLTETRETIEPAGFDLVFCLEVLEHLPPPQTEAALATIERALRPGGVAVIGVPHEIYLPALLKGLFRLVRRPGQFDARPRNILAATLGRPPQDRPLAEISAAQPFYYDHLGFDHRALARQLAARFRVERTWYSPLPLLGAALNSEVYFKLRRKAGTAAERG